MPDSKRCRRLCHLNDLLVGQQIFHICRLYITRHTILTTQIAAVGNGDSQVVDLPACLIFHRLIYQPFPNPQFG